jgi:hypothetical protein
LKVWEGGRKGGGEEEMMKLMVIGWPRDEKEISEKEGLEVKIWQGYKR